MADNKGCEGHCILVSAGCCVSVSKAVRDVLIQHLLGRLFWQGYYGALGTK